MRKYFTLFFCLFSTLLAAQPTITNNDMPLVGDTIITRSTTLGLGINYQQTGANFTWDFSGLTSNTVGADTFISVNSTPLVYQLAFNLPFDPNKANLASPQTDINLIPNLPLTDIMNFYRKTTASYGFWGYGAKVAGVPIPIKFNAQDIVYKFPLTSTSSNDSSEVSFAQGISGVGYLAIHKKRLNTVDGWGTMITPAGSYSTLRVKSIVQETDSIYIDSLSIGFSIPRNYTEYKWLTNGKGLPVMKVSNENFIPTFTWLDSAAVGNTFSVSVGQASPICPGSSVILTANATGGTSPYFYIWSNGSIGQSITVSPTTTTTYSVTATDANFQFTSASVTVTVYPAPSPLITKNPDVSYGCSNGPGAPFSSFVLSASSGFSMYNWSNGITGPNATSINITYPSVGYWGWVNYGVDVTDQNGCMGSATDSIYWDICGAVPELSQIPDFTVYPNPTTENLRLNYSQSQALSLEIEIFDALGILIKKFIPNSNNTIEGSEVIDLKLITGKSGLYFIRISNSFGSKIQAVILE